MREALTFLAQNYAYLLGIATALFALRVGWDAYRTGASPLASISRGIAMAITFFVVIKLAPALFEWGVNDAATRYQNGTVGRNLLSIAEQGVNLAINATTAENSAIVIPTPEPLTEFASKVIEEVAGSSSTQAAQPTAAPAGDPSGTKPPAAAPSENLWTPATQPTPIGRPFGAEYLQRQQSPTIQPTPHAIYTPQPGDLGYLPPPTPQTPGRMWTLPTQPTPVGRSFGAEYLQRNGGGGPQTYTVVAGDNLGKIASRLGVDAGALCRANRTTLRNNCDLLRTGMVLAIP